MSARTPKSDAAGSRSRTRSCAKELACHRCEQSFALTERVFSCPQCGKGLDVVYDYELAARYFAEVPNAQRPYNIWRFEELLPIVEPAAQARVGLTAGFTPLIRADRLGAELGLSNLYLKDDSTSRPSLSYKDRVVAMSVARLLELLDELKLPAAHNANSLLYEHAPQVMAAIRKRGDEVVAHGRTNAENLRGLWQPDEERILREVTETIARHEGAPPAGWMGSGAYETAHTLDLLKELGYRYVMDWPMDDQPVWLRTRAGPILSVPYPIELNDSQVVIHRRQDAADFCDMIVDQFDEMIDQCERHPLVMNVSVHTYVFGQPLRLRRLRAALAHCTKHRGAGRVWWCRPREIVEYCTRLPAGVIPGSGPAPGKA